MKVVAHRGKGPTSKYTDPKEALWMICYQQSKLVGEIVPQNILEENGIRLPDNTPPENTIAAFRQGLEEGADAIELDIFLSKDGVPMAIHDDELNRNVSGARRAAKKEGDLGFLGNVSDYTAEELKQFDMGKGNRIPTLQDVIDFVALFNKVRIKKDQQPIILNIEFKDKTEGNVEQTITVITKAAKEGKIIKSDVIYCSFDHNSLAKAMEIDQEAQVALALKTAYLFGDENVNIGAGWTVSLGNKYKASAISDLNQKITDMQAENGGKIVALDAVLWDIEPELIELAKSHRLALHASTSDFRDFSNMVFIGNLVQMNKMLQVFFKTDEPAKINAILMQAYAADTLDLSDTQVIDYNVLTTFDEIQQPMTGKSNQLDLSGVSIFETTSLVQDLQFLRLPKPGQPAPDDYFEPLIKIFSNGLAEFINSKLDIINEQSICQAQEESITDLSGDIVSTLSGLELIQYYYWDLE
jgi:glycerophosphoryl diester phosphodiesterase